MIVVDNNVLVYATLEAYTPELNALAQKLRQRDPHWILPTLWRHEYLNTLNNYVRHDLVSVSTASNLWLEAYSRFHNQEAPVDFVATLKNAHQYGLSSYDAQYLTLAESHNCPLITEDKVLRGKARGAALSMSEYLRK